MAGPTTWALLSDGVRARVLRGIEARGGEEGGGRAASVILMAQANPGHRRAFAPDRAGRSFASDGSRRCSGLEAGTDRMRRGLYAFARARPAPGRRHGAGAFDCLALIASPRMLGILRAEMPGTLGDDVVPERPADPGRVADRNVRAVIGRPLRGRRIG
jgi:protein required for attachment to host cells